MDAPPPPLVEKAHTAQLAPTSDTPRGTGEVLSMRAKRRLASYLRLRLLELHEEGLARARDVILGRLRLEELLEDKTSLPHDGGKTASER
jgi:hypothetical protein